MALGLQGHLKVLARTSIYEYLSRDSRSVITIIALLLGMATCYAGTRNQVVAKMLTVHVSSLHPDSTTDLEVPPSVQIASLMGLGLLYMSTTHRRMAEVSFFFFGSCVTRFIACLYCIPGPLARDRKTAH